LHFLGKIGLGLIRFTRATRVAGPAICFRWEPSHP
jgi:hypothetical protein